MDAATLEQMNKLRKSLGLPLLNAPGTNDDSAADASGPTFKNGNQDDSDDEDGEPASTLETREAAGFENFKQMQDEERKRVEREKRKKTIQRARELAARSARLEGKGLGDVDDAGDLDAKAWLKGQKKRQKGIELERARRVEEEIAERERLAALEYTSKDLAGVQVAHEVGDFEDGLGEQILTLKDQEVIGRDGDDDDDEGDVLENADMVAKDKLKDKLDLKKKIAYDVHDTENKELLSQYDDKKRKAFTLDASGEGTRAEEGREAKRLAIGDRLKDLVSLDILKQEPVSDYLEVKIKKPKKIKKNKRQKVVDEEDDIFPTQQTGDNNLMEVDGDQQRASIHPAKPEAIFNDDEDLASALSFTRRAALKKQKKKASDLVRQLKEEQEPEAAPTADIDNGLTLNDTTTFLDNLASRAPEDEADRAQPSVERASSPSSSSSGEGRPGQDVEMGEAIAVGEDEHELLERLAREQEQSSTPALGHTGLDEEKSLDQGLGAALSMLRQRGLVKAETNTNLDRAQADRNKLHRDRATFISESKLRGQESENRARVQRERDRTSGKLANLSTREREEHARWQNTHREHQSSIAAAAAFNDNYKPDVELKYVDDDGRLMNAKEAFKHLSHKFHGKGSGKGKTEKHLKKVADEKRREARSVLDASAEGSRGYEGAASHQRKGGQAGVRLQ